MIDACGRSATRTRETTSSYSVVYRRLCQQSGAESIADGIPRLRAVITWWKARDGAWRPATIRQYRAAICAAADTLRSVPDWQALDEAAIGTLLSDAPAPRPRSAPRRTSARKRKSINPADFSLVVTTLLHRNDRTARILAGMLLVGVLLGLRPCEWPTVQLEGDELTIYSAKTTNGRGIARRTIELDGLGDQNICRIAALLRLIRVEVRANGWQRLYSRIAKYLYRICKSLKIRPICLYSVRHQCLANAKCLLDRVGVAALAGHLSVRTAATHYARRRSGWRETIVLRPNPATRAAVRVTMTATPHFRANMHRNPMGP